MISSGTVKNVVIFGASAGCGKFLVEETVGKLSEEEGE
jgi:hypothetical protein